MVAIQKGDGKLIGSNVRSRKQPRSQDELTEGQLLSFFFNHKFAAVLGSKFRHPVRPFFEGKYYIQSRGGGGQCPLATPGFVAAG